MLIRCTSLTSDECDGRAMSSAANDRFVLGSLDASIPREGVLATRKSVGNFPDGGGKGIRRDGVLSVVVGASWVLRPEELGRLVSEQFSPFGHNGRRSCDGGFDRTRP